MGNIRITMWGSFSTGLFETTAEEGGHVAAIRRCITFLNYRLTDAVIKDASLVRDGIHPSMAPLGQDCPKGEGK